MRQAFLVLVAAAASLTLAGGAASQHGPTTDHLLGSGAFGNIQFVGRADLTDTPDLVADVAVSPNGQWAFLANWGEPTCSANAESGPPDAGAWVVDISDLTKPKKVGFIPSNQDSRPGEGMQVVNITTKQYSGDMLVMNNEQCGKNGKGGVSLFDVTDPRNPVKLSETSAIAATPTRTRSTARSPGTPATRPTRSSSTTSRRPTSTFSTSRTRSGPG